MRFLCVIAVAIIARICNSANILVIAPFGGKSHYIIIESLVKGLVARGHNVDVVANFISKIPSARYNFLDIRGTVPIFSNNWTMNTGKKLNAYEAVDILIEVGGPNLCELVFNSKTIRNLRNTTKKYDLLILHYFGTNCMLGFAHLFSVPAVGVITSVNLPWSSWLIGLPDNPAYIPTYFSSYLPQMTFMERLLNSFTYVMANIIFYVKSNVASDAIAKKFFGPELPNVNDLANNISLIMVNSHFSIHQSRPLLPNFLEIGGIHIDRNITLSQHFNDSLKTNNKGIIYLSFGSMLLSETMNEKILRAFFQAIKKLPYKVMWRATREKFPKHIDVPNNVQFESWMPQLGILCHPNVKLFISHGGGLSVSEAVYCGVPILGIPFHADQSLNIKHAVSKDIAIEIPYDEVTEDKLLTSIKLLIEHKRYRNGVEKASVLFRDRPTPILETAIYWIEYVIRHKGASHLKSTGANLPWYQYFLLDVILVITIFFVFIVFSLNKLLSFFLAYMMALVQRKVKQY